MIKSIIIMVEGIPNSQCSLVFQEKEKDQEWEIGWREGECVKVRGREGKRKKRGSLRGGEEGLWVLFKQFEL